jgi:signal transduction histidine kinase
LFVKLKIDIVDSGVGIKKENLSKLFLEFGKLDEHSKINSQGTGLGLSICKRMIEQMGGQVSVDSEFGVGSTFTINLNTKALIRP